jgi:putative MFS transporter
VRAPRWTRIVPWPARMPALEPRQWRVIGLLGAAEFADHYDVGLLSILMVQIQRGLGVAEEQIGLVASAIRMGAVLSLAAGVLADRIGRRRLLLFTVLGFTTTTFLTAFARTPAEFTLFQLIGRGFLYAETAIAIVVVTEVLAARDRGFGIGLLGALGAFGHGAAALALSFVETIPYGWRALYALGALPLLGLAWLRRGLPETARFAAGGRSPGPWWRPLHSLATAYPGRLLALLAVAFSLDFSAAAAVAFMAKTLQEVHGYAPGHVTLLYLCGGVLAVAGNQAAGIWSDRVGRKPVLMTLLVMMGVAYAGFYDTHGFWIAPLWILQVFALQGVTVLVRALGSELFPTSYRSTASSLRMLVSTLGGSAGLALESYLYGVLGSHAAAISALLPALGIALVLVWFTLPETAGRELEEVSPERASS